MSLIVGFLTSGFPGIFPSSQTGHMVSFPAIASENEIEIFSITSLVNTYNTLYTQAVSKLLMYELINSFIDSSIWPIVLHNLIIYISNFYISDNVYLIQ